MGKYICDSHHAGLYRSLFLLFHEELGHEIYFPDDSFATWANEYCGKPGSWLGLNPYKFKTLGGISPAYSDYFPFILDKEQFLARDWDAVIATREESISVFEELLRLHPNKKIKKIYQIGNECTNLQPEWRNVLSSDLSFYNKSEKYHRILYSQQLGKQYCEAWQPVKDTNVIACFNNCLPSFIDVCDGLTGNHWQGYPTWQELKKRCPNKQFKSYGINCEHGFLDEVNLPAAYNEACLILNFKGYDGYGHSILQGYSMGRVMVLPTNFAKMRTMGKYLNSATHIETEYSVDALANIINNWTVDKANEIGLAIWFDARKKMDWPVEAKRIQEWMENLI